MPLENEKLISSEDIFQVLFNDFPHAIVITDESGRITNFNPKAREKYGYSRENFVGKSLEIEIFKGLSEKNTLKTREMQIYDAKGNLIWVQLQISYLRSSSNKAFAIIFQDITALKENENKLKNMMEFQNHLIRLTAHELKSPLSSIIGYADLVLKSFGKDLNEKFSKYMQTIIENGQRQQNTISKLLKTYEIEQGVKKLRIEIKNIVTLINQCIEEIKGEVALKHIEIVFNHEPDEIMVELDQDEIHDVIINFLSNAIKYSYTYGKIEITAKKNFNFVIISIKDNGIGFSEEEKTCFFTKFGKIKKNVQGEEIEGTGLGLNICKGIIDAHKGHVYAESEGEGKGSNFYFLLPLKQKKED
ncbi:MAG: ATP-binding protein [Promethearchaeota archaeon]